MWVGRKDRTVEGFFLAGRSTPWWAVAACIVATETSVLTFTSVPGFAYEGDFRFLQLAAGFVVGRLGIALWLLPAYFRGEVVTTYELLGRRFGDRVRSAAAAIFLVYRNLADGVRLHAAALMVAIVAGVPEWWCILALAAAMVAFSEEGGVRATIWTDAIQLGVYLLGAGVIVATLAELDGRDGFGGFGGALDWIPAAAAADKFRVLAPSFDLTVPYTLAAGVLGGAFLTFATHGADQYLAQRLLAAKSLRHAQIGLVLSGIGAAFQFCLFLGIGAWLWTWYDGREFARPDEVLPTFVAENLGGVGAGIALAAVVAAALSPSLVSLSSTTVRDFWLPWRARRTGAAAPRSGQVRVGRQFVVVWGLVQTVVALIAQRAPSALEAGLSILSYASGPTVGAFALALIAPGTTPGAVLFGMAGGFLAPAAVRLAGFPLAWTWDVLVGSVVTAAVGVALSRFVGGLARERIG